MRRQPRSSIRLSEEYRSLLPGYGRSHDALAFAKGIIVRRLGLYAPLDRRGQDATVQTTDALKAPIPSRGNGSQGAWGGGVWAWPVVRRHVARRCSQVGIGGELSACISQAALGPNPSSSF